MISGQHESYSSEFGQVDLVPGTLRGYRGWRWDDYRKRLMSTGFMCTWDQSIRQPDATCLRYMYSNVRSFHPYLHPAPNWTCTCGYYASYNPEAYEEQAGINGYGYIHGAISAHGRIVLGTGGFRAQKVRVDAFWGSGILGVQASEAYGVPWFTTRKDMLKAFPPSDVSQLLKPGPPLHDPYEPIRFY